MGAYEGPRQGFLLSTEAVTVPAPLLAVTVTVYKPGTAYVCSTVWPVTSGLLSPKSHSKSTLSPAVISADNDMATPNGTGLLLMMLKPVIGELLLDLAA